jgi:hypothetical protein
MANPLCAETHSEYLFEKILYAIIKTWIISTAPTTPMAPDTPNAATSN